MTHRQRIASIFAGKPADRPGFWLGCPSKEIATALYAHFAVTDDAGLRRAVDDDFRWIVTDKYYRHPEGKPIFDVMAGKGARQSLGDPGCFADCEDTAEVDRFDWPDPRYLDFDTIRSLAEGTSEYWRLGGTWSMFFHVVSDFFGMENYFIKMHTNPAVVHAVTRHVVDFYLQANRRAFAETGDIIDTFFLGNDLGTQRGTLISPEMFRRFILPYLKELIDQAKSYGKYVQMHSCGSVAALIPMLIDAGVDALHPLQARAEGMDARSLARQFRGKLVFVGGVDTQELLWRGTPQQVKDEIARLRDIFGQRWVISPSHEAILPEVPIANVIAMCEAATGKTLH